jgi:DNA-binding MarR family transcriptional regulator
MTSPTIQTVTDAVEKRLDELRPAIEEYEVLMQFRTTIHDQLATDDSDTRKTLVARLEKTHTSKVSMSDKVLEAIRDHGEEGASVPEIADEVRTATSYVYRIARNLEGKGLIIRRRKRLIANS